MGRVAGVLDDPPGFPYTPPGVDVLEGGKLTSNNVVGNVVGSYMTCAGLGVKLADRVSVMYNNNIKHSIFRGISLLNSEVSLYNLFLFK